MQDSLNEKTFAKYIEGFGQVAPQDLLEARGGSVRYAIDTMGPNDKVVRTQYRLGGRLIAVDPQLRYIRLLNPYATAPGNTHRGISWSVQLERSPGERLRLWYMPPASKDEVVLFRKLLQQLENGDIKITKTG